MSNARAARQIIDALRPALHNRAIAQALAMMQEHHARMEDDLYALEEPEV
ncbi:hypothetical protein [Saccharospirillum sp.]